MDQAIPQGTFSAAALLVAVTGEILFEATWGHLRQNGSPCTCSARFDLASLTKPLATASIAIHLVSNGRLSLEDPLERFVPASCLSIRKRSIRLRHLLNHSSGFPAYRPYFKDLIRVAPEHRRATLRQWLLSEPLEQAPGHSARYSDLGFMLLGMVLEEACGLPLDRLFQETLATGPQMAAGLGYRRLRTTCDPKQRSARAEPNSADYVATEACPWRNRLLIGEVHDENAYCLDGIAGHAGLFGTAKAIWTWLDFLGSIHKGKQVGPDWSPEAVREFWNRSRSGFAGGGSWALGFDTPSPEGSSSGRYFSPHSIGHLGFTGTSFWLDLEQEIMVVLLTNRVHPTRDNDRLKVFRPLLHDTIMEFIHAT